MMFCGLLPENVFGCQFCKPEDNARIAENGFWPQPARSLLKSGEILIAHFHIYLNSALSGGSHLFYRYFGTL